tara:strand:+ start:291 stop:671 length:381 start_codon:yes stop_codon:yes gene_type:complete
MSESNESGKLQNYSVDQAAGAVVLVLGAVASLLLVIWQSKCHCKMNLCWIFQCERRPPSEEEMEGLKEQAAKLRKKNDSKQKNKKDGVLIKGEKKLKKDDDPEEGYLSANEESEAEPEPEPEPTVN